jgi:PelA/Pel-15E family pectate lyase
MKHNLSFFLLCFAFSLYAAKTPIIAIDEFNDGIHHWKLEHKNIDYPRIHPDSSRLIADNLLAWQNADGGWPKNIDWLGILNVDSVRAALRARYRESTLDNRNVFPQIRYLAKVYTLTKKKKYRVAAVKGLRYLLATQHASGGWRGWDVDAITFNDEIMTGVMELFLEIKENSPDYKWVPVHLRKQIIRSYEKALDLTLRCQVSVNGQKTAWGQQHDHKTLLPCKARTFELASLTANESCDVLLFLMKIPHPSTEIVTAIEAGVKWLEKSALQGIKVEKITIAEDKIINHMYPYDLVVVKDSTARDIWARFYEIETNCPFMATRQGEKVFRLEDVDPERRTGYAWYGYWPEKVLKAYPFWKARIEKKCADK